MNIYLKSNVADYETIALVDSGATRTIIPKDFAEILSLGYLMNPDGKRVRSETIGAGAVFYCNKAVVQRLAVKKHTTPFCTPTNIQALVPENKGVLDYVILGRDYLFKRFDITFHESRQQMSFTRI